MMRIPPNEAQLRRGERAVWGDRPNNPAECQEPSSGALPPIVASNWKPINKNTLVGSADIYVTRWRFRFYGVLWHRKGDQEWISLPAKEWTGADGKRVFTALGKFENHGDQRRFSEAAIVAIKQIAGEL
jgi:hypothetical protein